MLCELCHERNATVHITLMLPEHSAKRVELCTVCFPQELLEKEQAELLNKILKDRLP
jgi:protein-arginine kinase activator protein McsA